MDISRYLIHFLDKQEKQGYNYFMELCENILDRKKIEGLDKYPRELIAIELEKMIMMCIDQDKIRNHFPSYFKKLNLKEPLIYQNANILKNYIRLFIRDRKNVNTNKDLEQIENFYNNIIEKYSKMPINRVITLPGGTKTNMNDMLVAVGQLFNNENLQKPSLLVKKTEKKARKAAAIGTLVSTIGISLIIHGYAKSEPEPIKQEPISQEQAINDEEYTNETESEFVFPSAGVFSPDVFIENYNEFEKEYVDKANTIENLSYEEQNEIQQFQGYQIDVGDEEKNREIYEKLKYLYELCQKEDVDFNIAMTIWHQESDGHFNCNGIENASHDFGEMQINECNLKSLNDTFKFVEGDNPSMDKIKDVFKNDWKKNMVGAVYIIKGIEKMYDKGDYREVFGCYNGWIGWKSKKLAQNYSEKASGIRENIYNKSPEELLSPITVYDEDIMEVANGRSL